MTLVVSWFVYPALAALLFLGCGLLVDAVAGRSVPGALLVPLGLAATIVIAYFAVWHDATAPAARWAIFAAAIAGLVLGRRRLRRPLPRAPLIVAGATFLAYGAPVLFSGEPSWAGFIKLDDTATWFAMTEHAITQGYDLSGMAPSTFRETLRANFPGGYPVGAFLPFGASQPLGGQDLAWIFQPYLALLAALAAVTIHQLLAPLGLRPLARGLAAFVAAQAATLYAYALWGGIKELTAALLLPLGAAMLPIVWKAPLRARRGVPLAVVAAALVGVFGAAAGVWLLPLAAIAGAVPLRAAMRGGAGRAMAPQLALAAAAAVVLVWPAYRSTRQLALLDSPLTADAAEEDIGNLFEPLSPLQIFGVWPADDFRVDPSYETLTYVLIALGVVLAIAGVVTAVRRRAWGLLAYLAVTAIGSAAAIRVAGAWIDAKTMAFSSPLPVTLAVAGGLAFAAVSRRRPLAIVATVAAALVAGGVVWSNVLAYRGVSLAPYERMDELRSIGERFAGQRPALFTDASVYGGRWFLRDMDGEGASDLRWRPVFLYDGTPAPDQAALEADDIRVDQLLIYRALVLRNAPDASRPPAPFRLAWRGRYYEVWLRDDATSVVEHLALGEGETAAAPADCREVQRLTGVAISEGGTVAAARRTSPVVAPVPIDRAPIDWLIAGEGSVAPTNAGTALVDVTVPEAGRYGVWLKGSVGPEVVVRIDGRLIAGVGNELEYHGEYLRLGDLDLAAGRHAVALERLPAPLAPGVSALGQRLGPVALSAPRVDDVERYAPDDAKALCGESLDWIEVVRP